VRSLQGKSTGVCVAQEFNSKSLDWSREIERNCKQERDREGIVFVLVCDGDNPRYDKKIYRFF
jgi:hypothetical protein